jgi:serine/threonine protein kinase
MSGERIGQYTLIEPLAATSEPTEDDSPSGFSGVPVLYLARDQQHQRPVVIRLYDPDIRRDPEAFRELARRVKVLKSLRSRFIERIFEADLQAERPYVVSDFVPGQSLAQLVRQYGPLPAADVGRLAAELVEALVQLHQHGIVHGDLRPENVLLPTSAELRVIDVGFARRDDDKFDLAGPGWVAEVKATPSVRSTGPADDIFGWGLTVYFAATAMQPPTDDQTALAAFSAHSAWSRLQPQLESLLVECLQPNPSVRPDLAALELYARNATATLEKPENPVDEADSAASQSDHRPQPAGTVGRAFARSFVDGFGRLFDILMPLKIPEPLPPFESTIGRDLHELCLALGLRVAEEDAATSEPGHEHH